MIQGLTADILLSIIIAAGFSLTALYVAITRRHKPTWKAGVVLLLACAELTLARALQGISPDFAAKVFWYKMIYLGFTISPTAFFCLALRYGMLGHLLTLRTRLLLSVFPALTAMLIFTNEIHGWMWNPASTAVNVNSMVFLSVDDAGIWYWLFIAYAYLVMGLGCFCLVRLLVRSRGIYGWQAGGVVIAAMAALLGCGLDIVGGFFQPFTATALGLAVGTITIAFALAPLRRRDLMSVTRGAIINSISDSIVVVDEDDRIVDMNPAAERLVGKSTSQAIGKPLAQALPELRSIWAYKANSGEVTLHRENTPRTLDLRVSTIQDWQGRLVSQVIVLRDVTERKQVEERLAASLQEKEVLLREIHHRVKNNLQVVSSLLDLQGDYVADPQMRDVFRASQDRVHSMALVHEMLYKSQDLAQVNFAEYVVNLVDSLALSYGAAMHHVMLHTDMVPVSLSIETAVPCGLILNELVSNALKHGFPDGKSGAIHIELRESAEHQLILVVRDDGVGLPADVDLHRSQSLGLTIVMTLAKQLRGTMQVRREAGTEFKITFASSKGKVER